jgi:hypothetical protein
MSDNFYFLCLGISIGSAIIVPMAFQQAVRRPEGSGVMALCAGFGISLGFACSLPFGRTNEMPWYPYVAAVYFGGLALSILFYRSFRLGRSAEGHPQTDRP